ncbi:hypothetical protein Vretifemale_3694 [Volvox reticuliferus]|nr:hypothetical protein Vretifemale_3694 [Volvox reticuliferus]
MTSSTAIIGSSGGSDVSSRGRYSRLSGAKAVLSAAAASPAELAGAALVLAHCRHVPPYSWLVRYCAAVARQLHLFGPRELSTLLYGIGRLGPMGLRVDSRWLDRLLAEVERMAAPPPPSPMQADSCTNPPGMALRHRLKLDVVAAAAVEHDYAGGGGGGGGAVFAILENRAAEAAVAAEVRQECAASAAVHSGLNSASTHLSSAVSPPPRRRQHDHDQLPGTERLSAAQLAILLWAVARLGHKPPGAWVAAMARQVAARLEEFEAREIATTIRALQELAPATAAPYSCCSDVRRRSRSGGKWRGKGHSVDTNGPSPCDNGSSDTSTSNDGSCGEAVAGLAIRLAAKLPERNLYSTLRAASLSYGSGMPYATIADQLITDVYSVRSLGLLQGGGADAGGEGKDEGGQERPNGHTGA